VPRATLVTAANTRPVSFPAVDPAPEGVGWPPVIDGLHEGRTARLVIHDGTAVWRERRPLVATDPRRGSQPTILRFPSCTLGPNPVVDTVRLLVTAASNGDAQPQGLQAVPTPGACSILSLNLGPLDLNRLGLRVALDHVVLLIEAIPGAGALLGNLLCAVAGLLDGGLGGALGGLLNNLLVAIGNLLNGLLGV
jgi:hypothetical protein